MIRAVLVAILLVQSVPATSHAHQKSVSYSKWVLTADGAVVQVRARWLELTSLPFFASSVDVSAERAQVLSYLQAHLTLQSPAGACEPVASSGIWMPAEPGWARVEWRVRCEAPAARLRSDLFASLTNHVHLATVVGTAPVDVVLSRTAPEASVAISEARPAAGLGSYVRLGVEHILTGWDHLAFLLLLIVVAPRLREVALLVTGFTVGHSVTLGAAALGMVIPHARAVEATIAASILIVALEDMDMERARGGVLAIGAALALFVATAAWGALPAFWGIALFTLCYFALLRSSRGADRLRWLVACLFGFVHGLGFSGVLLEQELPRSQLVQALFGFNVGVELGQLAVVLLLWPVLEWVRRRGFERGVVDTASIAGAALATFALLVRVFGA